MPYTKPKHYIWTAFVALCQRERITAAEAIARLQTAFPYEAVESICRAEGDTSRTLEQIARAPLPEPGQPQSQGATDQGQQGSQQQIDPNDINASIRARASGGMQTETLSRSAITGIKDQPEYDPGADIFRSRYAEKYG